MLGLQPLAARRGGGGGGGRAAPALPTVCHLQEWLPHANFESIHSVLVRTATAAADTVPTAVGSGPMLA